MKIKKIFFLLILIFEERCLIDKATINNNAAFVGGNIYASCHHLFCFSGLLWDFCQF